MRYHFLRVTSGALVIVCAAAPGSATDVIPAVTTVAASVPRQPLRGVGRAFKISGGRNIEIAGPAGCSANGQLSFVGGGSQNYAGGTPTASDAGVLDGQSNESCDSITAIAGGGSNTIGGDQSTSGSFIGAGFHNGIEGGPDGFIGSGNYNTIGLVQSTTGTPVNSAIVAGTGNDVSSPDSFIGGGGANAVLGDYGVVGGGSTNIIGSNGFYGSVVGGSGNVVSQYYGTVGGGLNNSVGVGALGGVISGGSSNSLTAQYSFIGGGVGNVISGEFTAIGGGYTNNVSGEYGSICGGYDNVSSGKQAVVGGGYGNSASGKDAAIPGGSTNIASGSQSFAAGTKSTAGYTGDFVWSDYSNTSAGISATAANQFLARSAGGFYFYSSANSSSGVKLAPGSGSWSTLSDRAAKSNIRNVDDARILAKVASLPVSEWSYSAQGIGVRHLGPMAQDFRSAFGLGEDEKHISAVDQEGVALAAIKALQAEIADRDRKLDEIEAKYARLEQRLVAVEKHVPAMK